MMAAGNLMARASFPLPTELQEVTPLEILNGLSVPWIRTQCGTRRASG
jgi:hypothetical protein